MKVYTSVGIRISSALRLMYGQKSGPFLGLTELVEFCNKNRNFTNVHLIVKYG